MAEETNRYTDEYVATNQRQLKPTSRFVDGWTMGQFFLWTVDVRNSAEMLFRLAGHVGGVWYICQTGHWA